MDKTERVILIRGASGSGKSTLAKLFSNNKVICCADDYFWDSGEYKFDPSLLGKAHEYCRNVFISALDSGVETVIISNTNTTEKEFNFYIDEAKKRDIMLISLVIEKRHDNINLHGVPDYVIDRQAQNIKNSLKLI